jgi:uncharacterized membrane protein
MASLTVWKFRTADGAGKALEKVRVNDAAVVSWEQGRTHPAVQALGRGLWELLFSVIFFVPVVGAAVASASRALYEVLTDVGISDDFIETVKAEVVPGTSALFVLTPDEVADGAFAGALGEPISRRGGTHLARHSRTEP